MSCPDSYTYIIDSKLLLRLDELFDHSLESELEEQLIRLRRCYATGSGPVEVTGDLLYAMLAEATYKRGMTHHDCGMEAARSVIMQMSEQNARNAARSRDKHDDGVVEGVDCKDEIKKLLDHQDLVLKKLTDRSPQPTVTSTITDEDGKHSTTFVADVFSWSMPVKEGEKSPLGLKVYPTLPSAVVPITLHTSAGVQITLTPEQARVLGHALEAAAAMLKKETK